MGEIVLYYAVNKSGQGKVFTSFPERDGHRNIWVGDILVSVLCFVDTLETVYGFSLPDISWDDEPVMMKITFGYD